MVGFGLSKIFKKNSALFTAIGAGIGGVGGYMAGSENKIVNGGYQNATGQYISIEKSLVEAQKKRDNLISQIAAKNTSLDGFKTAILDVLSTYEFKKGRLKEHTGLLGGEGNLKEGQLQVERGLVFDPATGKIKTSTGTTISDLPAFLSNDNMGFKCIFVPPGQTTGSGYCPPNYGENENTYWPTAKNTLISNVNSYRSTLTQIPSLKSQLDAVQAQINTLKSDLDKAAKQDPALLKAQADAAAREREAKIAADAEVRKLEVTKQADAAAQEAKRKQTTKMVLIGGGLALAIVAAVVVPKMLKN